jgi:topoisomerase IV subunit A
MTSRSARRIRELSIEDELGQSFGRYAEKVILDRAIPDIRDGLKPVQRRIIFAMADSGNTPTKPYRKSAKTVGDVMGNYHPHGDSAIYDALVRMAQPWKMRYPLIDGHGNFGSMDDDPAAAMRYTEARLSPIAMELMKDIEKDTVPFKPNFDEKTEEPVILPAGFLNLLLNGTSGVSAGFATDVPSHNLAEVIDASLALLKDESLELPEIMAFIKGPDFPTGGIMMGAAGLIDAYTTGKGKVVLRARHTFEKLRDGKGLIVFDEIPYNVNKLDLVRQMEGLKLDKAVHGVLDVRDESGRDGLRLVLEISKTADLDGILSFYLKKTDLQINYHFNMVTIANNTPKQMGLKGILLAFMEHRRSVIRRRSQYDLDRAQARLHELEGLIKAVDILDEVLATIRASKDRADARKNLGTLGFTDLQADAILDLRLVRLTGLELKLLLSEARALKKLVKELKGILADPAVCDAVLSDELWALRDRHGDERRTAIQAEVERLSVALEVTVKAQDVVVGVTHQGWIKRVSMASYQAMNGDRKASGVRPGDRMHHVLLTNTTHSLLIFTAAGRCFPISVHQVPEAKWGDIGTAMVNVCGIDRDDEVVAAIPRADFPTDRYILMTTKKGAVKATAVSEFQSKRSAGLGAIKLAEEDSLAYVLETDLKGELIMLTQLGKGIRFELSQVSVQGRSARGVRGMNVEAADRVQSVLQLQSAEGSDLVAVFTKAGRAKVTPLDQHPLQRRGGKGVRLIISKGNQPHLCVSAHHCRSGDLFEVVDTTGHEHLVEAQRIPVTRRDGNAWTIVKLKSGALVALVEQLVTEKEEEEAEASPEADPGATEQAENLLDTQPDLPAAKPSESEDGG